MIDCGEPEMVAGGNYTLPDNTWYGASFTFVCGALIDVDGSSKAGNNVVMCQESGNWDFGSLTCLSKITPIYTRKRDLRNSNV